MALDTKWTGKPWKVDSYDPSYPLGVEDGDGLKVNNKTAPSVEVKFHDCKGNRGWVTCTHVPASVEPDIREHLEGSYGGTDFHIYLGPGTLRCEIPEDGGEGPYTSWTALEGA